MLYYNIHLSVQRFRGPEVPKPQFGMLSMFHHSSYFTGPLERLVFSILTSVAEYKSKSFSFRNFLHC
jgi:hypothetical protein